MKKENITKLEIILLYSAMAIFIAFVLFLYFHMFHGALSDDSYIWANFGNYINGLLTPFLTIVNIIVFVKLTMTIDKTEEQRSAKALETEKQLLLLQLRKQELDNFARHMIKLEDYSTREEGVKVIPPVIYYLEVFEKTGLKYFDLKDNHEHVALLLRSFCFRLNEYVDMLKNDKEFDEELFRIICNTKEELMKLLIDSALTR